MKKSLWMVFFILGLLMMGFGGCSSSGDGTEYKLTFRNNSSYDLDIEIWSDFKDDLTLIPEKIGTITVKSKQETAFTSKFQYITFKVLTNSTKVISTGENSSLITFTDKQEQKDYKVKFRNNSSYDLNIEIWSDIKDELTVIPEKIGTIIVRSKQELEFTSKFQYIKFNILTNASKVVYTGESSAEIIFTDKVAEITLKAENRTNKNINGTSAGSGVKLYFVEWGIEAYKTTGYFKSGEETTEYYSAGKAPVLSVGSSDTKTITKKEVNYFYFVMLGTKGFEYYRTEEEIEVGTDTGSKQFAFYNDSDFQEVDEYYNDKIAVTLVEITNDGKRTVEKIIPIIRIK